MGGDRRSDGLHDLEYALEISDRIIVLKNGCKYGEGRPQDIIT